MGKEVEFKIKITEEEFETFLNNRNKIKSFHLSDMCLWAHKSDKYYKSILQDETGNNRFVRIRKECTRFVRIRNGMIDLLKNTEYDGYPHKIRTLVTIKNKYVDPSTKCEINEEDEIYCDEKQSKFFEKMCTDFMIYFFSKEKTSIKFTHKSINIEFVSVPGVDGVFLEIEDTSNDNGSSEQISHLESIVTEMGFNPENKVQESWIELMKQKSK